MLCHVYIISLTTIRQHQERRLKTMPTSLEFPRALGWENRILACLFCLVESALSALQRTQV